MRKSAKVAGVIILVIAGLYSGVCVYYYLSQYSLMYTPENHTLQYAEKELKQSNMELWPTGDNNYWGIHKKSTSDTSKGTILFYHGDGASALGCQFVIEPLENLGFHVLVLEYPGYGAREGEINEETLVNACLKSTQLASEQFGQPIYFVANSLGAGVACAVAGRTTVSIKGLLLIAPWDSLPNLIQKICWYLPAKLIVKDQYNSVLNLRGYEGNVGIVMAGKDTLIPKSMTEDLYNSIECPKYLWVLEQSGHINWPDYMNDDWWRKTMNFVAGIDLAAEGRTTIAPINRQH